MADYARGSHTVHDIKYHFVWLTKYRYKVLKGKIAVRLRELLIQGCTARGMTVIEGAVGHDHVHMLVSCPTELAPSKIAQYLKGRSSRLIQDEFPELKKRYWGQHLGAASVGKRLLLRNGRKCNEGDRPKLYSESNRSR